MKIWIAFLLAFMLNTAWAKDPTIVVLGDSLSAAYGIQQEQGWVAQLQTRLHQEKLEYQVINASISGETSAGGLARLPTLLDKYQPAIVILELGANDGLRGLPLANMQANLQQMIQQSISHGASALLIGIQLPPNYGPVYTKQFQSIYSILAQSNDITLLPFLLEGVAGNRALFQADGLHPVADAQPHIMENVWAALKKLL